jgi:light-regulated signal transduction histidine kinase (bacteriophytochrome)
VSARKQAESKLRELNEQLDRKAIALANSNAELERFAYVASHDLQEPLRMVSSFLQLLQRKYSDQIDELSSKYIDFAVDGAERMKQLINDLLEYSRISLQGYALESVDVEEVVAEVQSLMAARITDTKAVLEIGEMPIIHANRIAVQQLLLNLVSNALKYHEKGSIPVVRINCEENLLEWKFTVTDNGIGIDKAFQEKIFIIFQRLHNREEYAGTGIGLAICKKIVDHLQGRIGVDSRPGQGSTFYFTIPRREITE